MNIRIRPAHGGFFKVLILLMLVGAASVLAMGTVIYLSVRPDRVFRDLQAGVLDALPGKPELKVALRAPSTLVSFARFGLAFVHELEPDARLATEAVRGGQVGVYRLSRAVSSARRVQMLRAADEAMKRHKWDRIAAVLERGEMVLVYVPADLDDTVELEAFTVVLNRKELVIASIHGDLDPLYELVRSHLEESEIIR